MFLFLQVPSNIAGPKPFSYTPQGPPAAAPKSPSSYPPPSQQNTWAPPSVVAAPVQVAAPIYNANPKPSGPVQGVY